jgi:hypothetical protein
MSFKIPDPSNVALRDSPFDFLTGLGYLPASDVLSSFQNMWILGLWTGQISGLPVVDWL